MKKRVLLAAGLVAVLGAACGGEDGGDAAQAAGGSGGASGANGGSVTLKAADFAFQPTSLSASSGGTIRLTNSDDAKHNLTVEEAGIDEDVDAGSTTSVSLEGVEAGSYDFLCEFHPAMKGTLEVTG